MGATQSSESLISQALQQQLGTTPYLMRADLQLLSTKGVIIHAEYTFDWVTPTQWKEVTRIENYERIRVRDAKGYWQINPLGYQPEINFQIDTLLHLKKILKVAPKETLSRIKRREKDGVRQNCIEVRREAGTNRTVCFDEVSGALAHIEYPQGGSGIPPAISRIDYSDFHEFAGKLIPFEMKAFNDKKVIISAKVRDISKDIDENPARFAIPQGAEFWAYCDDMQPGGLVNRVQPKYPLSARESHEQGRVTLYAVVETDGALSHLALIHRATPDLESAAIDAVRQWRYKPATCGPTPVRVETSIEVDFWLQN